MKVVALIIVSLFAMLSGVTTSAMIGGFGSCAISVDAKVIGQVGAFSLVTLLVGLPFGSKMMWLPFTCYAVPVTVLGSLLALTLGEPHRVFAAIASVLPGALILLAVMAFKVRRASGAKKAQL